MFLAHAGYGGFWIGPLIFFGFLFLFFAFAGRRWKRHGHHWHRPGISILEERYAKGEIGKDEFLARKQDLLEA